jgi:PAS domain S-box-containing protein
MSFKGATLGGQQGDELTGLIATLHETQQRIFELTGGAVDAVLHPSGSSYLLKDAQAQLRQNEAVQRRFATERAAILDALPANIALLNSRGTISAVNKAWRHFALANVFQGSDAAVGQNYIEVCEAAHGDCSSQAMQVADGIRSVLSGGARDFAIEYPCHSADEQRWFRMLVTPLQEDQSGGCVVMHVNITERRIAEDALRRQASLLRIAAQVARMGSWLAELSSPSVIWSDELRAICEMPPGSSPTLEQSLNLYAPEWRDRIRAAFFACVQEGTRFDEEVQIITGNGNRLWIRTIGEAVRDTQGRIAQVHGAIQDISAAKEAQKRLEQQAALLDAAQDAILVVGVDGLVQFWNAGAERIYGWTAAEAVGQPVRNLLYKSLPNSEKALATVEENLRVALQTGRWVGRLEQCKKDGSTLTAECTFSVLRDDQGKPHAFLGINTDITERIALEEQYRQLQRLESVGQLTGGIAHDFNNLLTIILGNAELLVESLQENPPLRPLAEMTMAAAERGAELVGRLLAFARRQPLDAQATDIAKLISGMTEMLKRTVGVQSVIQLVCHGGLWDAFVDGPQLENALLNLCINARHAMPEGGQLTIEATNVDVDHDYAGQSAPMASGQYIMLAVSDTGVGMPPEVLARAFDPFFTTKDVGQGSGLGLSMVFGFIKQSMGHVTIYSEVGRGTSVRLYLPRATTAGKTLTPRLRDTSIPAGAEKILYVEDDEHVRKHVTAQLKSLGYRVETARNGWEAIGALERTHDFDLLFTDIMMPKGMNGRQLADRALALCPSLAVLFTSGFTEGAILHQGRLDHGNHILPKPFRTGDLARKIRQVLD